MPPAPKNNRRWLRLTLLGFIALCFAGTGKPNPGGPFISVLCDVFPVSLAIYILVAAVRLLSDDRIVVRFLALFPMPLAVFSIVSVVEHVLEFWTNRFARGPMIGL